MALKYPYVFGEENVPGYAELYRFARVPVDNIMRKKFAEHGALGLSLSKGAVWGAWSRMRDYSEHFKLQSRIRDTWSDSVPLAVSGAWGPERVITTRNTFMVQTFS